MTNKVNEIHRTLHSSKAHIMIITESWLNSEISDEFINTEGFKAIRRDRGSKGGGILVFIANQFNHNVVELPPTRSFRKGKTELLSFLITGINLLVICVYLVVHRHAMIKPVPTSKT